MDKAIRVRKDRQEFQKEGNLEFMRVFNSIFVKIFFLGISAFILWSVYNSVNITIQKLEILKKAEREVEDLRIQNLYLSISVKDMSTDKYLEKEARNKLNFGDNGEILFVIPESVMTQAGKDISEIQQSRGRDIFENENRWNVWVKFILQGI